MHGRYPDYDVLDEADALGRADARGRARRASTTCRRARFFTDAEAATLRAFCDVVLAQDAEPRIPVLALVDEKLAAGQPGRLPLRRHAATIGETWRLVARGLDETRAGGGDGAVRRAPAPSSASRSSTRSPRASSCGGAWDELNVSRAWSVVHARRRWRAFYSHPWAWNEIGFGGPAYPRGYARLGVGHERGLGGRRGDSTSIPCRT